MQRLSLKEQQQKLREDLILQAVNALLAQKGYDLMTVDEVAAVVGIGKPSLYKHFESKEMLAAASMVRLLERTLEAIRAQPAQAEPIEKLRGVLRWALEQHIAGTMPLLPSTRSTLREALMRHKTYVDRLIEVSEELGGWIEAAQAGGQLADLPSDLLLYTLFARTCDPVLDYLRLNGQYTDAQIVDLLLATTFDGLRPRAAEPARARRSA
jgi:TetR/AcrR family transcriptional regulator of autoinduction and epiphytic fitness